jgi:MFS family permease
VLGRLVDRWGQTLVLVSGATTTAVVLLVIGLLLPAAPSPVLLIALASAAGLTIPPLAACVRTILPAAVASTDELPALFAFESTILELTFVLGPPLALGLGAVWSTGAALAFTGAVMLVSTLAFAAQPASRRWRPEPNARRPRGGSLHAPAVRTLVLVLLGTGAVFGATDVGVTAATKALHSAAAAGPVLGLWGAGSLLGGMVATRLGGGARTARGLIGLLLGLAVGHGALMLATGSVPATRW